MASISIKDMTLSQTAITGRRKQEALAFEVGTRFKVDKATGERTSEVEGYTVDISALKGKVQTVKLPLNVADTVNKIREALQADKLVYVDFGTPSTLKGRVYAMTRNGQLLTGVSCTADELNIVRIDEDNDDSAFDDILD